MKKNIWQTNNFCLLWLSLIDSIFYAYSFKFIQCIIANKNKFYLAAYENIVWTNQRETYFIKTEDVQSATEVNSGRTDTVDPFFP